uniref:GRAM domain-containing protein n=1 Tax=Heterosigma akashiwo TaxID=2829 RepID=A0A6V1X380_HETAK
MSSRIQRKNHQVLDRSSKLHQYHCELIELLESSWAIHHSPAAKITRKCLRESELPLEPLLYSCSCVCNKFPGQLLVTKNTLILTTKFIGFKRWIRCISIESVKSLAQKEHSLTGNAWVVSTHSRESFTVTPTISGEDLHHFLHLVKKVKEGKQYCLQPENKSQKGVTEHACTENTPASGTVVEEKQHAFDIASTSKGGRTIRAGIDIVQSQTTSIQSLPPTNSPNHLEEEGHSIGDIDDDNDDDDSLAVVSLALEKHLLSSGMSEYSNHHQAPLFEQDKEDGGVKNTRKHSRPQACKLSLGVEDDDQEQHDWSTILW